ncbi:MAG: hypothetical protein MI922_29245 [Bacteroidales bacterium]|nr:hypothetical protein [Bacteroidales bacterium]
MTVSLVEILVPVAFLALVFLITYFALKYNYQLKKAILEKGGTVELNKRKFPFLEIGLTVFGIGFGLVVSAMLQSLNIPNNSKELLVGACILLFGGAGLVSAFFIRKNLDEKK